MKKEDKYIFISFCILTVISLVGMELSSDGILSEKLFKPIVQTSFVIWLLYFGYTVYQIHLPYKDE